MQPDQETALRLKAVNGDIYVNARDLTARIREIAGENEAASAEYGDPADELDDGFATALAFHAIAVRLDELADQIDLSIIELLSGAPDAN
jgi:hypothetical protein